jgi:FMN phosphatase YigB (HAD superfamily)
LADRLAAIGLDSDKCGKLFGLDSFGAQKPALRPYQEIAAALGCAPADITVVGDRPDMDGEGAKVAGMQFFHIGNAKDWETFISSVPVHE